MKKAILLALVFKLYSGGCLSKQDKPLTSNFVMSDDVQQIKNRESTIVEPLDEINLNAVQIKNKDTTFKFLIQLCRDGELGLLDKAMSKVSIESDRCKDLLLKNFIAYCFFLKDCDTVFPLNLNVNSVNQCNDTIVHYCVQNSLENFLKFVLSFSDLNPNAQNINGDTALRVAVNMENFDIVKLLLSNKKVDPNIQNNWGYAPLHSAVLKNNVKIVQLLLANQNIDPNVKNSIGNTPLHLACVRGHQLVVKLILDHDKIDTSITNFAKKTPLNLAGFQNFKNLMLSFIQHKNYQFTTLDLYCGPEEVRFIVNKIGCEALRRF